MSEVTISELQRNLQDHIKYESVYQERFEEKLDLVLLQVTKTNGRVSSIEDWRDKQAYPLLEDYKENRAQAKGAIKLWTLVWGTVVAGITTAGALYINQLRTDISSDTIGKLQKSTFKIEELKKGTDIYSIKIYESK